MAAAKPRIGVVALARPTFDVPYAEEFARKAFATLDALPVELVGSRELLFDAAAVGNAIPALTAGPLDLLLVLQVTFTDATMTVKLGEAVSAPLLFWSFPEPRSGGRLRLNSLCGINLGAHALGRAGKDYGFVHRAPDDAAAGAEILAEVQAVIAKRALAEAKIGLFGRHPDGFDTCRYEDETVARLCGAKVDRLELKDIFDAAGALPDSDTQALYDRLQGELGNLDQLEQEPLRKSLKTYLTLRRLADERGYKGVAVRCWPEFFTEFGCAACGAMALMNQDKTPAGCEADVYGTLTTLMLQSLAGEQSFMADLVDIDAADDSGVLWHCGLAPLAMADEAQPKRATIHSNRKKPLLMEFPLKPGRVTVARLSQAKNAHKLVLAGGEMVRAPISFSGTSGVIRFDRAADQVLSSIMREGLEHHYSFVYGDHRPALRRLAAMLDIPVVELT